MGLFDIFKPKAETKAPDAVVFAGQPIEINADRHIAAERMASRLGRLLTVENPSAEVQAQVDSYKKGLENLGYNAPNNQDEVDALINTIRSE